MKLIQEHPKLVIGVAVIVIVLAIASLVGRDDVPQEIRTSADNFFNNLAREAGLLAAELPDGTAVAVLVLKSEADLPRSQKRYQRIYDAIEAEGVSIRHVEQLVFNPDAGWVGPTAGPHQEYLVGFPYGEFLRVVRAQPDVGAVISLYGAPYFHGQHGQLSDPTTLPPLLATREETLTPVLEKLLAQGWVAKLTVGEQDTPPDSPDKAYRVVTSPRR